VCRILEVDVLVAFDEAWAIRELTRFPVRAGDHHDIAIWVLDPDLAMTGGRIDARLQEHLRLQGIGSLHRSIEVIDLEPQEDSVPRPSFLRIDEVRVLLFIPSMQLKDESTAAKEAVIEVRMIAAHGLGRALGPQELRVPSATRRDIADSDQWLRPDVRSL
jgi:hypothetical protein